MAGEDHDIEEINHTYIFGKRIEWKMQGKGAAGRLSCNGIEPVLDELMQNAKFWIGTSLYAEVLSELGEA